MTLSEITNNYRSNFFSTMKAKSTIDGVQRGIQNFKGKTAKEMSEMTSKSDCFVSNTEPAPTKTPTVIDLMYSIFSKTTLIPLDKEKTSINLTSKIKINILFIRQFIKKSTDFCRCFFHM